MSIRLSLLIVHAAVPAVCCVLIPPAALIFQSLPCECLFVDSVDPLCLYCPTCCHESVRCLSNCKCTSPAGTLKYLSDTPLSYLRQIYVVQYQHIKFIDFFKCIDFLCAQFSKHICAYMCFRMSFVIIVRLLDNQWRLTWRTWHNNSVNLSLCKVVNKLQLNVPVKYFPCAVVVSLLRCECAVYDLYFAPRETQASRALGAQL